MARGRRQFRWTLWAMGLALGALTVLAAAPRAVPTRNPHWTKDGCDACHPMELGKPVPIAASRVDDACLKCHDGKAARAEAHPIGGVLQLAATRPAMNWPTVEGKLGCISCHDVRKGCDSSAMRPAVNPAFLRLGEGAGSEGFCRNCHEPQRFPRRNPHVMLGEDRRTILGEQCLFCHKQMPDRNAMKRSGDAGLRGDVTMQCRACHVMHRDPAPRGHMGAVIGAEMLAYMRAREIIGLTGYPGRELLNQLVQKKARPTQLVPGPEDRMTCITCHNPHQAGVFPPGSDLAPGSIRIVAGKTVSPVRGQQWCNHCHQL